MLLVGTYRFEVEGEEEGEDVKGGLCPVYFVDSVPSSQFLLFHSFSLLLTCSLDLCRYSAVLSSTREVN